MSKSMATVLVVALVLVPSASVVGGPDAPGRPWHGILPAPDPAPDAEHFVCRVRDARTLDPIAGARWIRTPEWIAPWRLRHDLPIGTALSDFDGIVHLPTTPYGWTEDCHWLVLADGYGADHVYGAVPPTEVLLHKAVQQAGHVVDAMGLPVAGCLVEALGGCSHGTAAASARTDDAGAFNLAGLDPALPGQLWVAGPGIAADLLALDTPPSLGRGRILLAMEPGARYAGRVVDLLGAPLPGVIVRAYNEQRGPAAITDTDGQFVLEGAEPDRDLVLFVPGDLTEDQSTFHVSDAHPVGTPSRLVLAVGPLSVVEAEATTKLRIRARDERGEQVGNLTYAVVSRSDGRGPTGWTAEADNDEVLAGEVDAGEAVENVAPGPLHLVATDPFSPETFTAVLVSDPTVPVELVTRPQPRLRIDGSVPADADLTLAIPGASLAVLDAAPDETPWLPASVPAALCVEVDGRPPFFFEVGPVSDGVRTVEVALPEPRTLVLPASARDLQLLDAGREAYAFAGDQPGVLHTDASGPLTLRWTDAKGATRETRVDVPDEPGGRRVVDPQSARQVPETAVVRALEPDGSELERREVGPGEEVSFEREGWQTLRGVASETATTDLSWGACTLAVTMRDEDGPVDALVLVGNEIYAAPRGTLTVRGLVAGSLRVVISRRDVLGEGREIELALQAGETRTLEVQLPLP